MDDSVGRVIHRLVGNIHGALLKWAGAAGANGVDLT